MRALLWTLPVVIATVALAQYVRRQVDPSERLTVDFPDKAEFHFVRVEYTDLPGMRRGFSRGWWRQDWPEADIHFTQGIARLTRVDIGDPKHFRLSDPKLFEHPWLYATQVGYWDLRQEEIRQLREYFARGGFLVVDDFYGDADWEVFRDSMEQTLPGRPIVDLDESDSLLHVLYSITERTMIPGLRHLRRGPNGTTVVQQQGQPHWRAIYDQKGRLLVAINHNMDVGDAWEHADMPEYPEAMTALAYRFGINYIIYAMTH